MSSILTKMLLMILSSALSAVSTDGSSFYLSGSSNIEKYKIGDMKHKLLWKHNISRREVSWMTKKESSEDKSQYEKEECFSTNEGDAYTNKDGVWIFPLTGHVDNKDEGQYKIEANCNKSNGDTHAKTNDAWILHLNVLKLDEIKRGNVGDKIIILRLNKSTSSFPRIYHDDEVLTVLKDTGCDVNSTSHLYGRLRCERDEVENRYRIEIRNVAPADTGLYRVNIDGHDTERCFLNITGQTVTTQSNSVSTYSVQGSFPQTASSVSGIGSTVVTQFDTVTIQDDSEGINYSQLNNESLSSTAKSSLSENTSDQLNVPCVPVFITLIIVGFTGWIILIICCRRRMKRSVTYSL